MSVRVFRNARWCNHRGARPPENAGTRQQRLHTGRAKRARRQYPSAGVDKSKRTKQITQRVGVREQGARERKKTLGCAVSSRAKKKKETGAAIEFANFLANGETREKWGHARCPSERRHDGPQHAARGCAFWQLRSAARRRTAPRWDAVFCRSKYSPVSASLEISPH